MKMYAYTYTKVLIEKDSSQLEECEKHRFHKTLERAELAHYFEVHENIEMAIKFSTPKVSSECKCMLKDHNEKFKHLKEIFPEEFI